MIDTIVNKMIRVIDELTAAINSDIEDVKQANHEKLLDRNDLKLEKMKQIESFKLSLNNALIQAMENEENIEQYRDTIDSLETKLEQLSKLNTKLAAIVLPVKEMYKDIIDEISRNNGGTLLEVHA